MFDEIWLYAATLFVLMLYLCFLLAGLAHDRLHGHGSTQRAGVHGFSFPR